MKIIRFVFFIISVLLLSLTSQAQIEIPAKKISQVSSKAVPETVLHLAHARVILADYDLIKKDFPELTYHSNEEIDQWLIKHTAFISIPQTQSKSTNTEIQTDGQMTQAHRPPNYNRALVFEAGSGLIDSKGTGSLNPLHDGHGNGLATLGEMIREYLYQKLVQKVFDHSNSGLRTVGNYAVLDSGFRVIHNDGSSSQAGSVLRQAHKRASGYMSMLPTKKVVQIEKILREYGITTTGTIRDTPYDLLNAQGTKDGAVIDFGGFLVVNEYLRPARDFDLTGEYFDPKDPKAIKPNLNFRIPYNLWGSSVTGFNDSKTDNPFIWSHDLAESLATGRATRADAEQHLRNLLGPIDEIFKKYPRETSQTSGSRICRILFK